MKLTVKTLKGGKFSVDAEPSSTVAEVKGIIEAAKSELPAANMKLIHSGKVLKDDDTIESCNIKPNDFLVVMISKAKKAATPAPAPAAAAAAKAPAPATSTEEASASTAAPAAAAASSTSASSEAPAAASSAPSSAPPPASGDEFPAEVISNLTGMGFPEAEVRACLRAANGNPDVAVEFLTNGIPEGVQQQAATSGASGTGGTSGSGAPLEALRNHPQFDALRRLVQSNPATLQSVLTQIGQQQPELLREINANQAAFLEMMNEPVADTPAPAPSGTSATSAAPAPAGASSGSRGGMGMLEGMANPAQMAQMLQSMSPAELNEMAAMMGLTPEQLTATARMIGQMPPEQFQEYMMQAMQQGGAMGMGMPGMMRGGAQPHVLRLTEEEMAAVDRLTEMGFDRAEAAQAFLACDKNEALAANLLMDSAGDDGPFGFGGGGSGGGENNNSGEGDGTGGDGDDGDDADDMYD